MYEFSYWIVGVAFGMNISMLLDLIEDKDQ